MELYTVFANGSCPGFYPVLKSVLNGYKNCGTIGFYTGWNQFVPEPKKGSKNCAPIRFYMGVKQVLSGTLKGFILSIRNQKLLG